MVSRPDCRPDSPAVLAMQCATLAEGLRRSFARHSDCPALVTADRTYTYGELWDVAGRVAERLEASSSLPKTRPVALHAATSMSAYAVMLGIVRSGRAYLPLNPSLPDATMRRLAAGANASCIVAESDFETLIDRGVPSLDRLAPHRSCARALSDSVAAVVYTSASTGDPRGVVLTDCCVLFHALTYASKLALDAGDRVTLFPALSVGASISNVFGAWLSGAAACRMSLADDGVEGVLERVRRQRVGVLHLVPTVFRRLAASDQAREAFQGVRCIKLGGESVTGVDVRLFQAVADPSARLMNGLGITEAGGNVTFGEVPRDLGSSALAPVGTLVEGIEARVIPDTDDSASGELVVRSRFLAAGYVSDGGCSPFVTHDDGTRSLHTGDQVRRQDDGTWVHIGRKDQVVQVNGNRVSLPEVEAALGDVPGVETACVFLDTTETGRGRLLAAVETASSLQMSAVRRHVAQHVEAFKVPEQCFRFDRLPTLPGGKIDRVSLRQELGTGAIVRDELAEAPSDRFQAQLLAGWRHVLRRPDVGVTDSIFDHGADSLMTVELQALLERADVHVTTQELYRHPTVALLAAHLRTRDPSERLVASPVVLLKQGTTRQVLLVVPGGGSGVLALLDLVRGLPDELSVYGLQYPGIDGEQPYRTSVSELAAYFLDYVGQRFGDTPCALAGTSFGGMVAFEMARQLEQAGRSVPFLGLIDTYAPGSLNLRPGLSAGARFEGMRRWLLPIGLKHAWTWGNAVSGLRQKVRLFVAGLWLRAGRGRTRPDEQRFLYLMKACFMASRRYRVRPVASKIHFFSVEDQLPQHLYDCDESLGWARASRSAVEVIRIPGRHGTHMRPPHVSALGEKLGRAVVSSMGRNDSWRGADGSRCEQEPVQLSVVIPTWNASGLAQRAVDHLLADSQSEQLELIVVDDGSDDDTTAALRARAGPVTVITHERNRGFGAAVNTGVRAARGRFVAAVNNDVQVSVATLRRLCRFLESHPHASAAAPQLLDTSGHRLQVGHLRSWRSALRRARWRRASPAMSSRSRSHPYRADWIQGACLVLNRAALEDVGLFDEQFHLFAEEIDLFHRMASAGWDAWVVPDVEATHLQGATTRNHENARLAARFRIQSYRSMCIYYRKHFSWPIASLGRGLLALRVLGRFLRAMASPGVHWKSPRGPSEQLRCLAAVLAPCVSQPQEPPLKSGSLETDDRVVVSALH